MADEIRIVVGDTVHRAFRHEGVLYTAESDNLDAAAERKVFDGAEGFDMGLHPDQPTGVRFCKRCFPGGQA